VAVVQEAKAKVEATRARDTLARESPASSPASVLGRKHGLSGDGK